MKNYIYNNFFNSDKKVPQPRKCTTHHQCIVFSCPLNDPKFNGENYSFYKIPSCNRSNHRENWLNCLKIDEEFLKNKNRKENFVCSRHFLSSDFRTTNLKFEATPSQNIGCDFEYPQSSKLYEQTQHDVYELHEDTTNNSFNMNDYIGQDDLIPVIVNDYCRNRSSVGEEIPEISIVFDELHCTTETQTIDTEFSVCTEFCIASANNEQIYRHQCDEMKKIKKNDDELIRSLVEENKACNIKYKNVIKAKKAFIIEENNKKKIIINSYMKKCNSLKRTGANLKSQLLKKKLSISQQIDNLDYLNINQKSFCKLILKQKFRYTNSDKFIAQNIYYRSPSLYRYLRDALEIKLPSTVTVLSWCKIKFIEPGINWDVENVMRDKINRMEEHDKDAILIYDELCIKKSFVFNEVTGKIDGLVQLEKQRQPHAASQAGFFMLRGVHSNWRIPFNYYLSKNSIRGVALKDLILNNITFCKKEFNLKIIATAADQGSTNQNSYKLLGVTRDKPSFADNEGVEVIALYDYPHLFKSIRNTLLKTNILFNFENERHEASFTIIQAIFHEEENLFCKKLTKLSRAHIYPNAFEKMRVKFAVQVLSNTTAAAIRSICDTKDNLFVRKNIIKYAKPTAIFCEMMNNCFDCLNSLRIFDTQVQPKCGYLDAYSFLKNDMLNFLKSLKYATDAKCVDGLIQTIIGITSIAESYFRSNNKVFFITPSHFNQDPLENFFGKVRGAGGFNRHPNAYQIGKIFAKIFCLKLVFNAKNTNCEKDKENTIEMIESDWVEMVNDMKTAHEENYNETENDDEIEKEDEENDEEDFIEVDTTEEVNDENDFSHDSKNLDENSLRYLLGFCCKKITKCEICCELLLKEKSEMILPSENYILRKNYNFNNQLHLRAPKDNLFELSKQWAKCFENVFFNKPHSTNILQKIIELITATSHDPITTHQNCIDSIRRYFVLILLRYNCNKGFELLNKRLIQKVTDAKLKSKLEEKEKKAAKKLKNNKPKKVVNKKKTLTSNLLKKKKPNTNATKNSKGHQKLKLLNK